MVFDPVDFFCFAQWLFDKRPSPPSNTLIRTIINRAYYAALKCVAEKTNTETSGHLGHYKVVEALRDIDPVAASKLDSLRMLRGKADYSLTKKIVERDAEISLSDSRIVLHSIKKAPMSLKPYTCDFLNISS